MTVPLGMRRSARALVFAAACVLLTAPACAQPQGSASGRGGAAPAIRLAPVVSGLESPVHLTAPAGDPRLFLVEQPGRIRIVANGRLLAAPFLDLTDRVGYGGERGLLSMAFHPGYRRNGFFYVNYTDRRGTTRVERYRVSADSSKADAGSARLVISIEQPYSNHNGGHILFGPDGMLWIGMGDGGSANDPQGHGQNPQTLLGDLLRIDVDRGDPYAIPPDNPFARSRGGRPEIWATGLRNPWRIWMDAASKLLYIADVGQNRWEEIHVVRYDRPGLNFGWNLMEGKHPLRGRVEDTRFTPPLVEYSHGEGCSITGGVVYRGRRLPALRGHYLYADYCNGWIRSFRTDGETVEDAREWPRIHVPGATSFGVDDAGEAYVMVQSGTVYRIEPAAP